MLEAMKILSHFLLAVFTALVFTESALAEACHPEVVWLVRHAEKMVIEGERDPPLSPRGLARAEALAVMLGPEQPDTIYSTDFIRTRDTVAPLAELNGIQVTIVDPRDTESQIAAILSGCGQRIVVVGHSNTVPALIHGLGVEEAIVLDEKNSYGDLFELRWENGEVWLERGRFGD
jgi:broad specificity phosphatase PhoE